MRSVGCVLLTIETDAGITGESYLFALNAVRIKAFDEMIKGFGNKIAEDLYYDKKSKALSKFPSELLRVARRKILYIHDADQLIDLKVPPGNRLEALKGDLNGFHSIRINNQWRVVFKWNGGAEDVQVVDYHK